MDLRVPDDGELSWIRAGRFGLFGDCPRLEHVHLKGREIALGTVDAPALRSLVLESAGLSSEPLRQLAAGALPRLASLELWLGSSDRVPGAEAAGPGHVRALLARPLPALRRLGLRNSDQIDEIVHVVLASPILAQLEHLDLSLGTLRGDGARALLRHAPALQHLTIDVSRNLLPGDLQVALRAAFDTIRIDPQREVLDGDEDWAYVAVGE